MIGRDRRGNKVYELTDEEAAFQFESEVLKDLYDAGNYDLYYVWIDRQHRCSHPVVSRVVIHGGYKSLTNPAFNLERGRVYSTCVLCGGTPSQSEIVDRLIARAKPNRVVIHGGNDPGYAHLAGVIYHTPY